MYSKYNAERLTIQSGGTLNGLFVRNKLIDYVNIVIAPILVGGKNVPTLVDGEAIKDERFRPARFSWKSTNYPNTSQNYWKTNILKIF